MDEKEFKTLAKGLSILWESYWEKRGIEPDGCYRVVPADDSDESLSYPEGRTGNFPRSWYA